MLSIRVDSTTRSNRHESYELKFQIPDTFLLQKVDFGSEKQRFPLRLVFTSDGVVGGVVIRRVERYDLVKIKSTES